MPQQIYTVEIDGTQYDLEGDHEPTEAEARQAIAGQQKTVTAPSPARMVSAGGRGTGLDVRKSDEFAQGVGASIPFAGVDQPHSVPGVIGRAIGEAALLAAPLSKAAKVPGVVARGLGISKARAGANIEQALSTAKDAAVSTESLQPILQRYNELVQTGSRPVRAVTKFGKRIGDEAALLPQEAHDFASNISRMSVNEFNNLNPQMQRQVAQLAKALRATVGAATDTAGEAGQYMRGIKEYSRASKAAKYAKTAAKAMGITGAGTGALAWLRSTLKSSISD